jgi:hypothetical protein
VVAALATLCFLSGYAILAKNEALIQLLRVRTASQSPFIGVMGLALGAFLSAALVMRVSGLML